MIDKVSVQECAICGACINACPVDAISLDKVHLDFRYPQINEDICIHCNRCEKACPILGNKGKPDEGYPVAFAAKSENDPMRMRSSSGGAFYELADQMLRDGGYVCGAVFDDEFHVKHILSYAKEDILRMMGSKYAQSDVGYCYREVKDVLEKGCKVLFSGCPCQVAGLRTFLGKEYPNLVLVELICHGIPSDHMLQTYIGMQERKYGARLTRMEFRNKKKGWHNSSVRMEFGHHRTYSKPEAADAYMNGFLGSVTLKPTCYQCHFRNFTAGSDIILGDFWGAEVELPVDDNKGISAILVNSGKGMDVLDRCNLTLTPANVETVIKYNRNLLCSAAPSPQRSSFYASADTNGLEEAIRRYLEESTIQKLKRQSRYALRCIWHIIRGKGKPLY